METNPPILQPSITPFRFVCRSLWFYRRTHLGVVAGVALTAAILTGALAVGDSVRHTLRQLARARLGNITHALHTGDRYFRAALADEIGAAPAILVRGSVTVPDGRTRANDVQIVGVDDRFWQLGATTNFTGLVVNERLATQLGVRAGDTIILRTEPPAWLPRDAPLSGPADETVALRGAVQAVAGDRDLGRFSLQANQVPPYTVFVPLARLQKELNRPGRANMLLSGTGLPPVLRDHWTLADAELVYSNGWLTTPRVFLDPDLQVTGEGVLTYFVNEIRHGDRATPYSFVTATGTNDGIAINSWLADDLGARVGDELTLRYYVPGDRRELREESTTFRVSRIIPTARDDSWTPSFPGLADAENCRDWKPGVPIALDRIRPKDEEYWRDYRGTPKAFLSLAAGQKLWANRFGKLTAIRVAGPLSDLKLEPPAFQPVAEQAARASAEAQDFGQLFLGFSLFLIVAALLLTALLFVFNLEQRRAEIGLLRAVGFPPRQVRWWVLREGGALAVIGTVIGLVAGMAYTKLALLGLATVWRGAVGGTRFVYRVEPVTWAVGAGASLLAALAAMWFTQRHQTRQPPVTLLTGNPMIPSTTRYSRLGLGVGVLGVVGAAGLLTLRNAGGFFGAGACLLVAGIGGSHWLLGRLVNVGRLCEPAVGSSPSPTRRVGLQQLGLRNAARRRGRSLATIGVLASGVFLLVAVNAFHQEPTEHGTGGFAWYAETTLPVYEALPNSVAFRVRDGDDASCLNLNRAQQPRLLGVRPEELARRGAFRFVGQAPSLPASAERTTRMVVPQWESLSAPQPDGAVPAIGDEATVKWALGKKIGDTVEYTDERGRSFPVRIVGVVSHSILQGGLMIAERNFMEKFPSTAGYRVFLLDAVPEELARSLADKGFMAVPAARRLAEFAQVENTYLAIFQALGGLGLVLGSVGLALVVWRNVLERRGELALLQAVGFDRRALRRLVVSEHWLLVTLGVGVGLGAALVAVWPVGGVHVPVLTLAALTAGGLGWSWLAARAALRGPLLPALRNE